ncbi:MAG: EAL domain-containing protein [Colwellia sp.]|nr:EAL domain-containing protein [Colwellia sp.]
MEKYLPLQTEIQALKIDISEAHLWLEEAISGDKNIDIERSVMTPLKHKRFNFYGMSMESEIVSQEERAYLNQLKSINKRLYLFHDSAKQRWLNAKLHGIGSDLDQKFDKYYTSIIDSADTLIRLINKNIKAEVKERDNDFILAVILFLITNLVTLTLLYRYKKEQKRYEISLFQEKEIALVTLKSIGDAVVTTDINGNVTFLNTTAKKLTEHEGDAVYGLPIDEVLNLWNIESGKKIKTPIYDVLHNNLTKLISNGTKLISNSGKEYIISDSAAPVKSEDGVIIGTVLVFQDDTKKHIKEKELQKSYQLNQALKERMELALLGSQYGIWDWNINTNDAYLSPRWKEMLGYRNNELPNKFSTWHSRMHPDDIEATMAGLQENIDGKTEYFEAVHRLKHKNGHWVWILDRGKTSFNKDGKPIRMIGTHTDVSAENELKLKSAERGRILDNSTNEIFIFDANDFKFLYINKGAQKNIGYSQEELFDMTPLDIKPMLVLADFIHLLKPITENGKQNIHFSTVHQRKDGSRYNVDTYLQSTSFEGHDAYVAFILDVTQRKEAEHELEEQHTLMQNIVDTVPMRIFWKDKNLNYLGANKLFLEDTGLESINEVIGKNDFELPWGDTEAQMYRDDDTKIMNSGISKINFEETQTKEDGKTIVVLTSKVPLKDAQKNIIGVLGSYADITAQRKIEEELKRQKDILAHQAHHDALTGLPNRVLFNDRLGQAIEKAKRHESKVALLFIDLDHFKEINDSLGHDTGDKILKETTRRLEKTIRGEDTVARLGGDEFTVIMEDLAQGQDASFLAQKILHTLAKPINIEGNVLYVSSSIGISLYPDDGDSSANLLKYADSAMYKAKYEGRNNFQFYSAEMTEIALERVIIETSLREALKGEDFVVYYQPQVNGLNNKIVGMEALVRWQHSSMGLISPVKFIPIAESTGLIIELDRFVMKTAMTQFVQWHKEGLNPGVLAMNLSIKQIQRKDFIAVFKNLLIETGCKSEWVTLELTEGQIMSNPEESIKVLNQIKDIGVELAVDDFGTGYSSLAYLKKLPIDKLKIDRAFIKDLPDDDEDAGITRAVIALAKSLNLKLIAEGVETQEQKDFIVDNGCHNIQGYFYSKPIPADEMRAFLTK